MVDDAHATRRGQPVGELLRRAQDGDPDAALELFERHRLALASALRRRGVPATDVDDLLEQVCGRFLRNVHRIFAPTSFLLATASNVAASFNRRSAREREAMVEYAQMPRVPSVMGESRLILRMDLRDALAAGGERCRELIRAFVVREVSYTEYSRVTGTPRGTLGPAVGRCLRRARKYLESRGYEGRTP